MVQLQPKLLTDTWVTATWDDYLRVIDDPACAKAKGYYFNGQMRVETMGVGPDHASENTIVILAIGLFCGLKGIPIKGLTNCTYRKTGVREAQPDVSYYVGDRTALVPQGSTIANLDEISPPDLAIEVADSSLDADLGKKRLLYEEMAIAEYWVVDVENAQIVAFQIVSNGSRRIDQSQILPGLEIAVLCEAMIRRRQQDDSQVVAWLLSKFQS
ncbi:MAG: Uma2 family endonuclease [Lyngbya sp. HA4199-MV5]|jgi:Uma2 family endonuclease|nr:Uma2 family endonuclease [Lyngbya sp. HA4199-MV5]